jgi:hypothetical protein
VAERVRTAPRDSLNALVWAAVDARQPGFAGDIAKAIRGAPDLAEPPPLLPAYRDPLGRQRDSLGRGTSPAELGLAAMRNRQVQREALQRQQWLGGAYRDPLEASARLAGLIEEANGDLEATAWRLREIGPEGLGALRGKEGWLASRRAVAERRSARGCAAAIVPGREAAASRFAIRAYQEEVTQQHERDAIEVPELSLKARAVLEGVRIAMLATVLPRDGEGYDARMARRAAGVAEQWAKGQADPALAQEIDRFVAAATARLGPNGVAAALRAAGRSWPYPARTSSTVRRCRRSRRASPRHEMGRSRRRCISGRSSASTASGSAWPNGSRSGCRGRSRREITTARHWGGEAAPVEKSRYYEGVLRRDREQGDRRMHETGVRRDHWMSRSEGDERMAVEALGKPAPRRAELGQQLPHAEKEEAAAFARRSRQRRPSWRSARNGRASLARSSPNGGRSRTRPASGSGTAIATRGWSGKSRGSSAGCSAKGWPLTP